jgi:hypothetical protein
LLCFFPKSCLLFYSYGFPVVGLFFWAAACSMGHFLFLVIGLYYFTLRLHKNYNRSALWALF